MFALSVEEAVFTTPTKFLSLPPLSLSNSSTSALPLCCLPVCLCVCLFVFIAPCCRVVVVVVVDVSSFISLHSNEAIYEGKCVCVFSS